MRGSAGELAAKGSDHTLAEGKTMPRGSAGELAAKGSDHSHTEGESRQ
jgi:hypothetical protein